MTTGRMSNGTQRLTALLERKIRERRAELQLKTTDELLELLAINITVQERADALMGRERDEVRPNILVIEELGGRTVVTRR